MKKDIVLIKLDFKGKMSEAIVKIIKVGDLNGVKKSYL